MSGLIAGSVYTIYLGYIIDFFEAGAMYMYVDVIYELYKAGINA